VIRDDLKKVDLNHDDSDSVMNDDIMELDDHWQGDAKFVEVELGQDLEVFNHLPLHHLIFCNVSHMFCLLLLILSRAEDDRIKDET
jgi:hypothetical protein